MLSKALLNATVILALFTGTCYGYGWIVDILFLDAFSLPPSLFRAPTEQLVLFGALGLLRLAPWAFGLAIVAAISLFALRRGARWIRSTPRLRKYGDATDRLLSSLMLPLWAIAFGLLPVVMAGTSSRVADVLATGQRESKARVLVALRDPNSTAATSCIQASILRVAEGYFAFYDHEARRTLVVPSNRVYLISSASHEKSVCQ